MSQTPNAAPPDPLEDDIPFEAFAPAPPPPDPSPHYLAGLNEAQREAVEALDGPVLVLAGAGTGKTRVLTTRLAHLLAQRRAQPWQMLAVTFTNRAAREMQERVAALVGGVAEGMRLGTFHALAARILRRHAERVGLKPNFTILDADDQLRLVKQTIEAANIDDARAPARVLQAIIERWKDKGLRPEQVSPELDEEVANRPASPLYAAYQERLRALNACDFGDLLLHNLTLFTQHPDVLAEYHNRLRYILVDEYQDTNLAQYLWLRLLAQARRNICCVGDDDQSIYGWRGAEIGNILKFEKDFPGARVIRLERNYRSTAPILAAASGLIAHNHDRLGKTLWTEGAEGEKVRVRGVWDGEAEARLVGEEIESLQRAKHALNEMAVLVRAGFQTRAFEERLLTLGVPYRVIGGPRFYERQEIRDAIAYLRLVHQSDDDLAFERIVNKPKRGLGEATLQVLHQAARKEKRSLVAAARALAETDELKPAARKTLREFVGRLDRWRAEMGKRGHVELAQMILDESDYLDMWKKDKTPEAPGRLENLKELVHALGDFENLGGFLEHIALVMENNEAAGGDKVSLMTLHSAKGLEFETVFLPGWEEGLFPHQRSLDSGTAGLEEERRLAYVGLTRAKRRAIVSFAASRRIHANWQSALPSRFIDELPKEAVEIRSDAGLYGGAGRRGLAVADVEWGGKYVSRAAILPPARAGSPFARPMRPIQGRVEPAAPAPSFAPGARVFHDKFGYGTVQAAEGDKLTVAFDKSDTKKVIAGFLKSAA